MVNEFCGFKHGVIGTDKMPADTTLNNMKKADLIKLLHTAQHNYESLMWFYNNAVKVNMSQLNNGGWIPCENELPKENGYYLVTYKKDGNLLVGYWFFNGIDFNQTEEVEVLYWQHLPEPYQPKGE